MNEPEKRDYSAEVTSTSCPSCAELRKKLHEFKYELFRLYSKAGRTARATGDPSKRCYGEIRQTAFFEVIKLFVEAFPNEHPEPVEAPSDFFEEVESDEQD